MKGRKPKAVALRIHEAAPRRTAAKGAALAIIGKPPRDLPAIAVPEWGRLAELLSAAGVLSPACGPIVERYCHAFARAHAARAALKKGAVLKTKLGGVKTHPAAAIVEKAETFMVRCLAEMGLTPTTASKLKPAHATEDALTAFLASK